GTDRQAREAGRRGRRARRDRRGSHRRGDRRLHPQPARAGPGLAAPAGPGDGCVQPLPEPDRAGPAQAVGRGAPADRPRPAHLRRGALRAGRHPRRAPRDRRHRRRVRRPGPDGAPEAGAPRRLPVLPPRERRGDRARTARRDIPRRGEV
ncbi:MAG: Transcriptional regulator, XRE family, partial [uncultured Pseudonocardia sp.]